LSKNKISKETENTVHEFYFRDDISRQAPAKRDYITVWKNDGKKRLKKWPPNLHLEKHLHYL